MANEASLLPCTSSATTTAVNLSWNDFAAAATAVGVLLAVYQLSLTRRDLRGTFEQNFVDRYNAIAANIDLLLLIEAKPVPLADTATARALFDYFDLCEEQLYYSARRKVSRGTWTDWWIGMSSTLENREVRRQFESFRHRLEVAEMVRFVRLVEAIQHLDDSRYQPPPLPLRERLRNFLGR